MGSGAVGGGELADLGRPVNSLFESYREVGNVWDSPATAAG